MSLKVELQVHSTYHLRFGYQPKRIRRAGEINFCGMTKLTLREKKRLSVILERLTVELPLSHIVRYHLRLTGHLIRMRPRSLFIEVF